MKQPDIIRKIKELRVEKGFSLAKLSTLTGLSKGYLSKIENADSTPPISTLHRIATALGTNLSYFFTDTQSSIADRKLTISKKKVWQKHEPEVQATGLKRWPLADRKFGRNMQPYMIELPADHHQVYQFEGEEFYFLLEGKVEFNYGGRIYHLEAGDSAYFDGDVPYSGKSTGEVPARLLMLVYHYKRVMEEPFSQGLMPYRHLDRSAPK